MQIFPVYKCPVKCARYLDDTRVNKIILETAQMLSTALRMTAPVSELKSVFLYEKWTPNHSLMRWVRATRGNFLWVVDYHRALCAEKLRRTGKVHAAQLKFFDGKVFIDLAHHIPEGGRQRFLNNTRRKEYNVDFKHVKNVYKAYRLYLNARWAIECESTRHQAPKSSITNPYKSLKKSVPTAITHLTKLRTCKLYKGNGRDKLRRNKIVDRSSSRGHRTYESLQTNASQFSH